MALYIGRVLAEMRRAAEGTFVSLEGLGFRWKVMGSRRTFFKHGDCKR